MKKSLKYLLSVLAVAMIGLFVTACNDNGNDGEGGDTTPVTFPEKIVADVVPGEEFVLTFDAETRWELSVPAESAAIFRIVDGANTVLSMRGTAGHQEVVIRVTDISDFSQDYSCEVMLKMNNQTEVIAELTLTSAERKFAAYVAQYNEADNYFSIDAEGFLYEQEATSTTNLRWVNSNQYMQRFKVEANFAWSMVGEIPAWLQLSTATGAKGTTEIVLTTVAEELPLEPVDVEFSVCDYRDAENPVEVSTFKIEFEGCKNMHKVEMYHSLRFNTIGDYYDPLHAMDYVAAPASGTIIAPRGVVFYTFAKRNGKLYYDRNKAWITFTVGEYPEGAQEKGLYHLPITITVNANTDLAAREAMFMALPHDVAVTITDPATQLYTDESQTEIAYDLRKYVFAELEQAPYVPPGVIDATNISTMRAFNSNFEKVESADFLTGDWAGVKDAFRLSYRDNESGDYLTFNVPFAKYELFGYDGPTAKFENLDECWFTFDQKSDTTNIYKVTARLGTKSGQVPNIMAGPEGENVAYLAFYDDADEVYAVIQLVMDANYVAPPIFEVDTSAVAFIGEETFDATIEFLKPGDPDYDSQAASAYPGVIQVKVTHRNAMASLVGMKLPEYATWRSTQSWLKISENAGLPCVNMMDLVGNSGRGVITFYDENSKAVLIMVCVFGYNG